MRRSRSGLTTPILQGLGALVVFSLMYGIFFKPMVDWAHNFGLTSGYGGYDSDVFIFGYEFFLAVPFLAVVLVVGWWIYQGQRRSPYEAY